MAIIKQQEYRSIATDCIPIPHIALWKTTAKLLLF